ncbi:hypothetical protein B0H19DRAFT_1225028 [Mycena capillaripes]|nr:hypothetical protein B0H19DRAFT_1225028 [Mycena capillaripes]
MPLINVCWAWYHAGIDMLYENIAFRNVGQISALLRTLKNQIPSDFGRMIKEMGVHCSAHKGYSAVFQEDLKTVIARAPRLSSVVLHSPSLEHLPIVFRDIPSSVTHLDCGPTPCFPLVPPLRCYFDPSTLDHPHFRRLTTLRCSSAGAPSALPLLGEKLILPSLKNFIFQCTLKEPSEIAACLAFCQIRGRNLQTLSFWSMGAVNSSKYFGSSSSGANIQSVLQVCPHLEHLILPGALASSQELSHPKVKWIDFWTMYGDSNVSFLDSITTPNFPAVKGIRQLIISAPLLVGHILTTIPPHLGLEEPFEFSYPDFFLQHGNNRIYRNDIVDSLGVEYEEDDESDESYSIRNGSSDSTSDHESALSSTSGQGSEEPEDYEWEADHENTLAVYDQLIN